MDRMFESVCTTCELAAASIESESASNEAFLLLYCASMIQVPEDGGAATAPVRLVA